MTEGKYHSAVVTGGSAGILGPIFVEVLRNAKFDNVFTPSLPEWDLTRNLEQTYRYQIDNYGVPRVLILNAAIDNPPGSAATLFPEHDDIINVNYLVNKHLCRLFWEGMNKLDGIKHIVFIGSILGNVAADYRNYPDNFDKPVDYGASKAACLSLVRNLAVRGAKNRVLVNQLSFGAVVNPQHSPEFKRKFLKNVPLDRFLTKEDVSNALIGILGQTAMTGQQMLVDGGYTCL